MTTISYSGYRFPSVIIQQAIWLYSRFTLSFRDVEALLAEREATVSYGQKIKTARKWAVIPIGVVSPRVVRYVFWGDQWCRLRTGEQLGEAHGVGTYPGLHHRDHGPGAAAAE